MKNLHTCFERTNIRSMYNCMQLQLNDDSYVRIVLLGGVSRVSDEIMHSHLDRHIYCIIICLFRIFLQKRKHTVSI